MQCSMDVSAWHSTHSQATHTNTTECRQVSQTPINDMVREMVAEQQVALSKVSAVPMQRYAERVQKG